MVQNLGGGGEIFEQISLKGCQIRHEDAYDDSHQSAFLDILSYIVGKMWRKPMELFTLIQLIMSFQQQIAHLPSSWVVQSINITSSTHG
jgi:hypothetical protein